MHRDAVESTSRRRWGAELPVKVDIPRAGTGAVWRDRSRPYQSMLLLVTAKLKHVIKALSAAKGQSLVLVKHILLSLYA